MLTTHRIELAQSQLSISSSPELDEALPDHNLVTGEDELGYDGGEPAHEMAAAIHHDRLGRYARHLLQHNQDEYHV